MAVRHFQSSLHHILYELENVGRDPRLPKEKVLMPLIGAGPPVGGTKGRSPSMPKPSPAPAPCPSLMSVDPPAPPAAPNLTLLSSPRFLPRRGSSGTACNAAAASATAAEAAASAATVPADTADAERPTFGGVPPAGFPEDWDCPLARRALRSHTSNWAITARMVGGPSCAMSNSYSSPAV